MMDIKVRQDMIEKEAQRNYVGDCHCGEQSKRNNERIKGGTESHGRV